MARKGYGDSLVSLKFCRSNSLYTGFLLAVFISVIFVSLFSDFLPVWIGSFAGQRFFQIFLLVFVVFFVLIVPSSDARANLWVDNWPAFLVSIAFLIFAAPLTVSDYRWVEAGLFAFFFLAFSVLGWGIRARCCTEKVASTLVSVVVVGCFFYAAMSLTAYSFAIADDFSKLIDIIPWGFVNMRYWSHLATWFLPLFPLALLCGRLRNSGLWRVGVFFTAGIWWWVALLTMSRGSVISLGLAALIVLTIFGRAVLPWLAVSIKFLLLGVFLWCLLSWAIPELVFGETVIRSLHAGASGRFPLWWEAWQMSLRNFPLGMGVQSWLTHPTITPEYSSVQNFGHPHNMYLMWAAEYGWALMAFVAILLGVTFKRLLSLRGPIVSGAREHASVIVAFSASCIAGLAHSGVSAVFMVPASMSAALVVLAVFWALTLQPNEGASASKGWSEAKSGRAGSKPMLACAVLILGVVWGQEVWRYHGAMEADLGIYAESPSAPFLPRFWLHGYFPRPDSQ
ncbi:O-antigen ligase family protein [Marinobacter apostichopi]|uniref:O-antigen ligase family protein n=1 Tax=Marinobacter apostichopi TaxID=3035454 RepID=UPI0025742B9B|nr:O-antigen ligase family protein [Marinobacter sp. LA51]